MTYISARLRVTRESRPGKVARWRPINHPLTPFQAALTWLTIKFGYRAYR